MQNFKNMERLYSNMEKASFGAGCFWSVEEIFRKRKGVKKTSVGYMGGKTKKTSYEQVCSGTTGHIEVLQIEYDPKQISYEKLLDIFWSCHDPTTKDHQGPDRGTQYRSVIFYHNKEQQEKASKAKECLDKAKKYKKKIVTKILPAKEFYRAEEYHQRYLQKRGLALCHI